MLSEDSYSEKRRAFLKAAPTLTTTVRDVVLNIVKICMQSLTSYNLYYISDYILHYGLSCCMFSSLDD